MSQAQMEECRSTHAQIASLEASNVSTGCLLHTSGCRRTPGLLVRLSRFRPPHHHALHV